MLVFISVPDSAPVVRFRYRVLKRPVEHQIGDSSRCTAILIRWRRPAGKPCHTPISDNRVRPAIVALHLAASTTPPIVAFSTNTEGNVVEEGAAEQNGLGLFHNDVVGVKILFTPQLHPPNWLSICGKSTNVDHEPDQPSAQCLSLAIIRLMLQHFCAIRN